LFGDTALKRTKIKNTTEQIIRRIRPFRCRHIMPKTGPAKSSRMSPPRWKKKRREVEENSSTSLTTSIIVPSSKTLYISPRPSSPALQDISKHSDVPRPRSCRDGKGNFWRCLKIAGWSGTASKKRRIIVGQHRGRRPEEEPPDPLRSSAAPRPPVVQ